MNLSETIKQALGLNYNALCCLSKFIDEQRFIHKKKYREIYEIINNAHELNIGDFDDLMNNIDEIEISETEYRNRAFRRT